MQLSAACRHWEGLPYATRSTRTTPTSRRDRKRREGDADCHGRSRGDAANVRSSTQWASWGEGPSGEPVTRTQCADCAGCRRRALGEIAYGKSSDTGERPRKAARAGTDLCLDNECGGWPARVHAAGSANETDQGRRSRSARRHASFRLCGGDLDGSQRYQGLLPGARRHHREIRRHLRTDNRNAIRQGISRQGSARQAPGPSEEIHAASGEKSDLTPVARIVQIVLCGAPDLACEVQISQETLDKIQMIHPIEFEMMDQIVETIQGDFTSIYSSISKTGKPAYLFFNEKQTSSEGGDPLSVAIKVPAVDRVGFLSTAHYKQLPSIDRLIRGGKK